MAALTCVLFMATAESIASAASKIGLFNDPNYNLLTPTITLGETSEAIIVVTALALVAWLVKFPALNLSLPKRMRLCLATFSLIGLGAFCVATIVYGPWGLAHHLVPRTSSGLSFDDTHDVAICSDFIISTVGMTLALSSTSLNQGIRRGVCYVSAPCAAAFTVSLLAMHNVFSFGQLTLLTAWLTINGMQALSNYFVALVTLSLPLVAYFTGHEVPKAAKMALLVSLACLLAFSAYSFAETGPRSGTVVSERPLLVVSTLNSAPHTEYYVTISYPGSRNVSLIAPSPTFDSLYCSDLTTPRCYAFSNEVALEVTRD